MKKLFALLLTLAMVMSMAACGGGGEGSDATTTAPTTVPTTVPTTAPAPTDEELLIGEWLYKADLGEIMDLTMAATLGDPTLTAGLPVYMDITFSFANDGKSVMSVKVDQESFTAYMNAMADKMVDFMYATYEAQGISRNDLDAAILAETGMSLKDAMKAEMDASLDGAMDEMEQTTNLVYKVDSEKKVIYIGEDQAALDSAAEGMNYKLEGTTLTVSDIFGDNIEDAKESLEAFGMELPWTFEKQ